MPLELLKKDKAAKCVLMVYPRNFYANSQTSSDNLFQRQNQSKESVQHKVIAEFETLVALLQNNNIEVIIYKANDDFDTPDEIFPNNWYSSHANGSLCLYPMKAENRRLERRLDIFKLLETKGYIYNQLFDFTENEKQAIFCEGTGSLIFDPYYKIAFAAISERTNASLAKKICLHLGYKCILFEAEMEIDGKKASVYHTNTLLFFAGNMPVFCSDVIFNKNYFIELIKSIYPMYIDLSKHQFENFCANTLHLQNKQGDDFLVMSSRAYKALGDTKKQLIKLGFNILHSPLQNIENLGGGSARCMLAEVF